MAPHIQKTKTEKPCTECGASFVGAGNQKFCAALCNYRAKERRRVEAGYYKRPQVAAQCRANKRAEYRRGITSGTESGERLAIWATHGVSSAAEIPPGCVMDDCARPTFARLKCKPHYQREMLLEGASWAVADSISGDDYRRRADKYGVPFEQFNKFDVYDRDGWTCGICLDPVDPELMYPNPMSVSLDHVVPLSRGGGHLESNAQCSHLSCNVRKGARHGGITEAAGIA